MPLLEFRQAALLLLVRRRLLPHPIIVASREIVVLRGSLCIQLRSFRRLSLLEFGLAALLRLVRRGLFPLALCRLLQPVLLAPYGLGFQTLTFRLPLRRFLRMSLLEFRQAALLRLVRRGMF